MHHGRSGLCWLVVLIGCGGGDPSSGGDAGPTVSRDGGRIEDQDAGDRDAAVVPTGPLSLKITEVATSEYQDCFEPTEGDGSVVLGPSETYLEARAGAPTSPPPDWTPNAGCTIGDGGMVCTIPRCGGNCSLLTYSA